MKAVVLAAAAAAVLLAAPPARAQTGWSGGEAAALRSALGAVLDGAPTLRGAHVGMLVESADDGRVLAERNADDAFQPASTLKLLVGSAALERLGPAYTFTTTLTYGDGRLVLHGGGDPLLRAADLAAAAEAAARAGVPSGVTLALDTSHDVPDQRRLPGWSVDDELQSYAPILNGLPFEENALPLAVTPAATVGAPPQIALAAPLQALAPADPCRPGPTALAFAVRARTVAAGGEETLDVARGRCGEVVVVGDIPQGAPSSLAVAVDQPEVAAWSVLAAELGRRGIAVAPAPAFGPIPGVVELPEPVPAAGSEVWRHQGEPLTALLGDLWLPSDNFIAERLLRELDAHSSGRPASTEGGLAIERDWLREIGVDPARTTLADGSGLSQYDRITPRALAAILRHDWTTSGRAVVLADLPLAGRRGDLRGLMRDTPAEGRVTAKTGSFRHVRGLAGYVATHTHGSAIFVLAVDDWLGTDADLHRLWTAFCSRVASE